jgi:dipeptidase E
VGRLFLYSDQIIEENQRIDRKLFSSFDNTNPVIAYIPSNGDPDRTHYSKQLSYYQQYGLKDLLFFDVTEDFEEGLLERVMQCDAIHLSGGNPIIFRDNLLKRGLNSFLIDYYQRGGNLIGVSGGAVQLGESAALYKLFQKGLTDALQSKFQLQTLQLASFEFLPHYDRWSPSFAKLVEEYSVKTGKTVYAADDGAGIIVEEGKLSFIGNIKRIEKGNTERVN